MVADAPPAGLLIDRRRRACRGFPDSHLVFRL